MAKKRARKDELKKIIVDAKEELDKIEETETINRNKTFVGKCYKRQDSYSCPETDDDYWWDYIIVTGLTKDGNLQTRTFSKDIYSRVIFDNETLYSIGSEYSEITKLECALAYDNLLVDLLAKRIF